MPRPVLVDAAKVFLGIVLGDVEDMSREGLVETPMRMAKALSELLEGYECNVSKFNKTFDAEGHDSIIAVRDIAFSSLCEHHVLPFTGRVSVAYLPSDRIIGLSKIPRIVRALSRRLQVQERLTDQIGHTLQDMIAPRGVAVIAKGVHTCMCLRGAEASGEMVTSCMLGVFRDKPEARDEVLHLFEGGGR
jgi:GTP cyclohydrolase I